MGKVLVDQISDRDEQEQLIREQIVDACREMNAKGINQGTSGNISVRFDQGCLITPTSLDYDDMEPDDIVYLLEDGTTDGPRKPSSEWRFHRDILMARPEFNAIVHAHPLKSTALAIMGREIPAVHYMVAVFGGPVVRCAPYATYGTAELSAFAVEAIKDRSACLLAHHGVIVGGESLSKAMWLAVELETLAAQYVECLQMGNPPVLDDDEIERVKNKIESGSYGASS